MYCWSRVGARLSVRPSAVREAHEAAVAGRVQRDEGLDPRIAYVLELLVVGAVHVRLMRAQPCRPPTHVEDRVQLGPAGLEARPALEGIAGRGGGEVLDGERRVRGLHLELDVAVRPPPQGAEAPSRAAVGDEHVAHSPHLLPLDLVAMALPFRAG